MRLEGAWREAAKFSVVGIGATLIHVLMALGFQRFGNLSALLANFLAYATAVSFSYFGNALWTFGREPRSTHVLRFLAVSLLGLLLNQAIVHVTVDNLGWPFPAALAVVIIVVPGLVFGLSKLWAFRPS